VASSGSARFLNTLAVDDEFAKSCVHQFFRADNFAAKNLRDALMTETNTEQRNVRPEFTN